MAPHQIDTAPTRWGERTREPAPDSGLPRGLQVRPIDRNVSSGADTPLPRARHRGMGSMMEDLKSSLTEPGLMG
jgi:hypothetical protein